MKTHMDMFSIMIVEMISQVYAYVKTCTWLINKAVLKEKDIKRVQN